jgi:FkbM family methyltransferase
VRNIVTEFNRCANVLGLGRALVAMVFFRLLRRVLRPGVTLPLPVPGSPIWVRARSRTSDVSVYHEVFLTDTYSLDPVGIPSLVVDAGANVGYSSILFALAWPDARVIALEPDESNFLSLVNNTRLIENVEPLRAALWGEPAPLIITNPSGRSSGLRVAKTQGTADFPTMTVSDVLAFAGADKIDLFKVDVEGSELNLLTKNPHCLDHVGLLVIELHERYAPGSTKALHDALAGRQHRLSEHGNTLHITFM